MSKNDEVEAASSFFLGQGFDESICKAEEQRENTAPYPPARKLAALVNSDMTDG